MAALASTASLAVTTGAATVGALTEKTLTNAPSVESGVAVTEDGRVASVCGSVKRQVGGLASWVRNVTGTESREESAADDDDEENDDTRLSGSLLITTECRR